MNFRKRGGGGRARSKFVLIICRNLEQYAQRRSTWVAWRPCRRRGRCHNNKQIIFALFGPGHLSNKPSAKLTICPQPGATWNYDYSADPFVPALMHLGETVKYYFTFYLNFNTTVLTTKHRKHIGHYRPDAALEAMEGIVRFEVALEEYVHKRCWSWKDFIKI